MCSPCPSRGNQHVSIMNGLHDPSISSSSHTRKGIPKSLFSCLRRAIFPGPDRSKISEPFNPVQLDISQGTFGLLERDLARLSKAPPGRRELMKTCSTPHATTGSTRTPPAPNVRPSAPARVLTCAALSSHPVAKLKKHPPADWKPKDGMRRQIPLAYAVHVKRPAVQSTAPRSPARESPCLKPPSHFVGRVKRDERENYRVKTNLLAPPLPAQPRRSARGVRAPANLAHKKTAVPSAPATSPSQELPRSKVKASSIDNRVQSATKPTPPAIVVTLATPSPPIQPRPSPRDIPCTPATPSPPLQPHVPSRDIPSNAYESKISNLRLVLIQRQAHHKDLEAQISVLSHQIGALAALNVVEKDARALATAKTLMQKHEIAVLTEKLAQSRALVEEYRGEMGELRARIEELEEAGRVSQVRRTGTVDASRKAPVSPKRLEIGEPLTPQARKTAVTPRTPIAQRKLLAPRKPAHKTSAATQTEESFLARSGGQLPSPPPSPRLQAMPTATVDLGMPWSHRMRV